jgi:protein gp37
MAENSGIQWTDNTFNPWWGCLKVSAECQFCYAEKWAERYGMKLWGPEQNTGRRFFGDKHWNEPVKWNKQAEQRGKRTKVFCASMADVFEQNSQLSNERLKVWDLIERTPYLDWQLLTKRPENILTMIPVDWIINPPVNVWYGTSIGDPSTLWRLRKLRQVPAHIRWLSLEPLIGYLGELDLDGIHWVVAGGESGPLNKIRETKLEWIMDLRGQCKKAGVPFFVKQLGSKWAARTGASHSKGGDIGEWPTDLQVRQFPA